MFWFCVHGISRTLLEKMKILYFVYLKEKGNFHCTLFVLYRPYSHPCLEGIVWFLHNFYWLKNWIVQQMDNCKAGIVQFGRGGKKERVFTLLWMFCVF